MKVTIEEEPRVFTVSVGTLDVGKVTSYAEKGAADDEAYHAVLHSTTNDEPERSLGWCATLEEAAAKVVDHNYGPCKFGKVKERIV